MGRYAALIRGINVGTANRVAMVDLRAAMSGLGFTHVRTLLNSGNAVFDAPDAPPRDLGGRITEAMAARFGLAPTVIVLPAAACSASSRAIPSSR